MLVILEDVIGALNISQSQIIFLVPFPSTCVCRDTPYYG